MAQNEKNDKVEGNADSGGRRFRLPKLFADSDAAEKDRQRELQERAQALGMKLPAVPVARDAIETANRDYKEPRASVLRMSREELDALDSEHGVGEGIGVSSEAARASVGGPRAELTTKSKSELVDEIDEMRENMEEMTRMLQDMYERGSAQEKVFNTLHAELQDYKNDFIYEHLKPVVRPLLFLYDSMENFDLEIAQYERPDQEERRAGCTPGIVRENVAFFREQLVESLRICEVTPMAKPEGQYDPRLHKAVDIALVDEEHENTIQRVVRSGWYLNGRVFRHAEVVVGKKLDDYNAQVWNYGHGPGENPALPSSASSSVPGTGSVPGASSSPAAAGGAAKPGAMPLPSQKSGGNRR
jgi:molecular chaperone GrpE (heat shock protein)